MAVVEIFDQCYKSVEQSVFFRCDFGVGEVFFSSNITICGNYKGKGER